MVMLIPVSSAKAQNACGQIIEPARVGEAESYCSDIYDRMLDYREQRIEFRKNLDKRRKKFAEPVVEARKRYEQDLADLNARRTHEDDVTAR